MPKKTPPAQPLRGRSVTDAIDALESRRRKGLARGPAPKKRRDELDLDSIR